MDQQQQSKQACVKCPRCNSTNTKFCYYNNYSLTQPRHFCKACKRYWTRGGTLRNVPVGGGCRKNSKRVRPTPSSHQVPQMATNSTFPAATETPNDLLTPSFYGGRYKDMIQQQQCNIYSNMNGDINNDLPTSASLVQHHTSQNMALPSSSVSLQANTINNTNQVSYLLEMLIPFQAMQHQQQPQPSSHHSDPLHHNQANNQGHDPRNIAAQCTGSSSMYWGATRNNVTPWPHNHLANMDGQAHLP